MARILIIDDEAPIRKVLQKVLRAWGHEVSSAENGRDGVELFRTQPHDLVITDLIMQVQGGLRTIAELRSDFPDLKIIAISGGSASVSENLSTAGLLGANITLQKPFALDQLQRAVEAMLSKPDPVPHV